MSNAFYKIAPTSDAQEAVNTVFLNKEASRQRIPALELPSSFQSLIKKHPLWSQTTSQSVSCSALDVKTEASNLRQRFLNALTSGGLGQIYSCRGGSKTQFALSCLGAALRPSKDPVDVMPSAPTTAKVPPSDSFQAMDETVGFTYLSPPPPFFCWIAEEGAPYPPLLQEYWGIPLSRFLIVQVPQGKDAWQVALESIQSGLFGWVFIRTQTPCSAAFLRKLQINAEKLKSKTVILCQQKLPHWPFKISIEIDERHSYADSSTHPVFPDTRKAHCTPGGSLPIPHPESLHPNLTK